MSNLAQTSLGSAPVTDQSSGSEDSILCFAGYLHNDLKPDNILLEEDTPNSAIKIADFGLARREARFGKATRVWPYGTPGFMAPEVEQAGQCSKRSDMYSVGGVLYFMLIGELHFEYENGMLHCIMLGSSWCITTSASSSLARSLPMF